VSTTYTVRWRPSDADPDDAWSEQTGLTETSFGVSGLSAGVRYDVEVIAVRSGVSSPPTTGASFTRCAAPSSVTTADVRAETATVSWTGVIGADAYRVERTIDDLAWSSVGMTLDGATTSLAVTGLTEQQANRFRVVAVNSVGDSAASNPTAQVTTLAIATGGTTAVIGTGSDQYRVHTFSAGGDLVLNAVRDIEYLLVGGGGGGGTRHGGGGGGGGVLAGTRTARSIGTYAVVVGAGGTGARKPAATPDEPTPAVTGGPSTFDGLSATGGGGGGSWTNLTDMSKKDGADGGSGGGAAVGSGELSGKAGSGATAVVDGVTVTLGFAGGTPIPATWPGTGGGGAGGVGGSNVEGTGGSGGIGRESAITGTSLRYGGGGGGGGASASGQGGDGGGGAGATGDNRGVDGFHGLGGGGGGARSLLASSTTALGGDGGDGVVILRYRLSPAG